MAAQNNSTVNEAVVESPSPITILNQEQEGKKTKFPGFNLYVKNLDDSFNDMTLRDAFDEFGTITSAKVMCDAFGKSRGFGFVCFTTQDEAHKALAKMNGRIVGTKPLYVAMAQKKEERKQYLSDKYKNFSFNSSGQTVSHHQMAAAQKTAEQTSVQHAPNGFANNTMMHYAYLPGEGMLQGTAPGSYIVPPNPGMSYVPVPYQPVLLVPGINMMSPPPQQMPIMHQPIYIHSSKTNTLIYSTSVQSIPQTSSPGGFPAISDGNAVEKGLQIIHRRNESMSPKTLNNLEPAADVSTVIYSNTNSEFGSPNPMPSPPAHNAGFPSNTRFTA